MSFLLDTNVISELVRKKPEPKVTSWVNGLDERQAFLSVITIGELSKGIERLREAKPRAELSDWLYMNLLPRFRERILDIDVHVMITWGKLNANLERKGLTMPAIDSMIAATALESGLTIATRNEKDFEGTGVNIINPWLA